MPIQTIHFEQNQVLTSEQLNQLAKTPEQWAALVLRVTQKVGFFRDFDDQQDTVVNNWTTTPLNQGNSGCRLMIENLRLVGPDGTIYKYKGSRTIDCEQKQITKIYLDSKNCLSIKKNKSGFELGELISQQGQYNFRSYLPAQSLDAMDVLRNKFQSLQTAIASLSDYVDQNASKMAVSPEWVMRSLSVFKRLPVSASPARLGWLLDQLCDDLNRHCALIAANKPNHWVPWKNKALSGIQWPRAIAPKASVTAYLDWMKKWHHLLNSDLLRRNLVSMLELHATKQETKGQFCVHQYDVRDYNDVRVRIPACICPDADVAIYVEQNNQHHLKNWKHCDVPPGQEEQVEQTIDVKKFNCMDVIVRAPHLVTVVPVLIVE